MELVREAPAGASLAATGGDPAEPWVDLKDVAEHIGYCPAVTRRMVEERIIPVWRRRNGARTYLKFKLSVVDAALLARAQAEGGGRA